MTLFFFKTLKFLFRHIIPPFLRYPLARFAGRITVKLNPRRRGIIVGNLTPLLGEAEARDRAGELLGNFMMAAVDFFCQSKRFVDSIPMDKEFLLKVYENSGHRLMMVTAHLGHWELGIPSMIAHGFTLAGVYAPYREDAVVEWIMEHRHPEVEWISAASGAAEACVQAIDEGKILGMVGDIPFGEKGRRVKIAGRAARLPIGPWAIAARSRATVVPVFIIREAPGRYRCIFETPLPPIKGSLLLQITRLLTAYRDHLERYLRSYPTQWGVLSPFWEKEIK
jgi:KDO2-lipid IV(A) lauroyltransferase